MTQSHTVVAILEAKPGKAKELEAALSAAAASSRDETTNIEYRLHQGIDNPQQFILYENWESSEKHQLQFAKPYIKKLITELEDLLAKPFEVFTAKEI